ncbi:MAG: Rab family GTPase [Candidatus Njordarchaeales archaeon]
MKQIYKVLFIGDGGVGKTSVCRAYLGKGLSREITIGIDVESINVGDYRILIWDLSGQEQFKKIVPEFLTGNPSLIVLFFDLSRRHTLQDLSGWISMIPEKIKKKTKFILVGNKADLPREVSREEVEKAIKSLGVNIIKYIETSAKTGYNINKLFQLIAKNLESK